MERSKFNSRADMSIRKRRDVIHNLIWNEWMNRIYFCGSFFIEPTLLERNYDVDTYSYLIMNKIRKDITDDLSEFFDPMIELIYMGFMGTNFEAVSENAAQKNQLCKRFYSSNYY
jgi:hypothetical protein